MAKWSINDWNAKIDRTLTIRRLGRQGILYEYELPYGANPMHYYEDAINVKSIKRSEQYNNGYRVGQYQPIGDKRYFNYYQIKKMGSNDWLKWLEDIERRKQMYIAKRIREAIFKEFGNNG